MKNREVCRVTALLTVVCMSFLLVTPCPADMESFLDQIQGQLTNLTPNSYRGQERGYWMGGSMSVRIPNETIQPFSMSIPRISAGCGGIDIVTGGFSYLGFQYLVDKFQNILSAAPAFAFQIALGTLCPDCKNVLDSLEMIADMINNLNINSCQASKAIGGYVGHELGKLVTHRTAQGSEPSFFESLRTSISDFKPRYYDFIRTYTGSDTCYNLGTANAINQCLRNQGTLSLRVPIVEQAFARTNSYKDFKDVIRAYAGDVYAVFSDSPQAGQDGVVPKWVSRCPGAGITSLADAVVLGQYFTRSMTEQIDGSWVENGCGQATATGMRERVHTILTTLVTSIRNGTPVTALSADEINLINMSSVPIWRYLSTAVLVERLGGDTAGMLTDTFIDNISLPLAYDMTYHTLEGTANYIDNLIQAAKASSAREGMETVTMIEGLQRFIQNEVGIARSRASAMWEINAKQMGDVYKNYVTMREFVHQRLAESKLLNSYLWAKGIR